MFVHMARSPSDGRGHSEQIRSGHQANPFGGELVCLHPKGVGQLTARGPRVAHAMELILSYYKINFLATLGLIHPRVDSNDAWGGLNDLNKNLHRCLFL